jgi:hypothetical protein
MKSDDAKRVAGHSILDYIELTNPRLRASIKPAMDAVVHVRQSIFAALNHYDGYHSNHYHHHDGSNNKNDNGIHFLPPPLQSIIVDYSI